MRSTTRTSEVDYDDPRSATRSRTPSRTRQAREAAIQILAENARTRQQPSFPYSQQSNHTLNSTSYQRLTQQQPSSLSNTNNSQNNSNIRYPTLSAAWLLLLIAPCWLLQAFRNGSSIVAVGLIRLLQAVVIAVLLSISDKMGIFETERKPQTMKRMAARVASMLCLLLLVDFLVVEPLGGGGGGRRAEG